MIRLTLAISATLLLFAGVLAYAPRLFDAYPQGADTGTDTGRPEIVSRAPATAEAADPLSGVTASVLASLADTQLTSSPGPTQPTQAVAPADNFSALTTTVLQSLQATGLQQPAQDAGTDLSGLIVQALSATDNDDQLQTLLDALVNEAADEGRVAVPDALRTAEGRVDTRTLLNDIVRRATSVETSGFAATVSPGAGAARPQEAPQAPDVYIVQTGDSLGAIAQRFYGDASFFNDIYLANRQSLASPNRIQVGQRLVLPRIDT